MAGSLDSTSRRHQNVRLVVLDIESLRHVAPPPTHNLGVNMHNTTAGDFIGN